MRRGLYNILENSQDSLLSRFYNLIMLVAIVVSILPLMFKKNEPFHLLIEYVTAAIFCLDYLFRVITADFKLQKGRVSFFLYPFTLLAVIDLICILPTF